MLLNLWLLLGTAWAGTAIWLDAPPEPELTPGFEDLAPKQAIPSRAWSEADAQALVGLEAKLAVSAGLLDVFDGELQIMRHLQGALDAVEVVRPEDRHLVWRAQLLLGLAVYRYFGDTLGTDPAASNFVVGSGPNAQNRAWRDAVALEPDLNPSRDELPDPSGRMAYQEARVSHLLARPAVVKLVGGDGTESLMVDGWVEVMDTVHLVPGRHYLTLLVDGEIRVRQRVELGPGQAIELPLRASADDLVGLAETLRTTRASLPLHPAQQLALAEVEAPVQVVVHAKQRPIRFELRDGALVPVSGRMRAPSSKGDDTGPALRLGLGGAWIYDGDYLLQNAAAGAPEDTSTVNAGAPLLSVAAEQALGPVVVGAGADLGLPLGTWHRLPSGETTQRLRAHPHVQIGLPILRLSAGWWTPWHLGLGARAHIVLVGAFGLCGGYIQGLGIPLVRDDGPSFEPAASRMGWVGVHWSTRSSSLP